MARYGREYGPRREWRGGRDEWDRWGGPGEGMGGAGRAGYGGPPEPRGWQGDWRGGGYVGGGPRGYDPLYMPAHPYDRGYGPREHSRVEFGYAGGGSWGGYGAEYGGGYGGGYGAEYGGVGGMRPGPGPLPFRGYARGRGTGREYGRPRYGRSGYDRGYAYEDEWGGPRGGFEGGDEGAYVETGDGRVRRVGGQAGDADRVRVADVMTDDPECVTPDSTVGDVAKRMKDLDVGIIPVIEDEEGRRLKGVVTDRDLAVRVLAEGKAGKTRVSTVMSEEVATVERGDTVHDLLDVMKRHRVRRVPVLDEEGRLVGIVAQADLAVDYAGLDLQRETEVEEVIERISEPAAPRRSY